MYGGIFLLSLRGCVYSVVFVLLCLCCCVCAVVFVLLCLCCCVCAVVFVLLGLCCWVCAVGCLRCWVCAVVFVLLGLLCCVQNFVRPPLTLLSFPLWLSYLCWFLCYDLFLDIFTSWSFLMSNIFHRLYHLFPDFPWFWIYFLLFSSLCPFFSS